MKKTRAPHAAIEFLLVAVLSLLAPAAAAEPAPYYLWASRINGTTYCAQTSPGEGWVLYDGPFSDFQCRKRKQ
ncbi:MAG: hypothetical protein ACK4N4_09225 [Burkholderiales bacterium]